MLPPIVQRVRKQNHYGIVVHRIYNARVVCVFTDDADPDFKFNYGRGDPVPLFSELTSRIMIAQLPLRRLRRLSISERRTKFGSKAWAQIGQASVLSYVLSDETDLRGDMRNIEKAQTRISAPIFRSRGRVIASFSQSLPSVHPKRIDIELLSVLVRQCAKEISAQIGCFEEASQNAL